MSELDQLIFVLFESLNKNENKEIRKKLHSLLSKKLQRTISSSPFYMKRMIQDELRNQNYKSLIVECVKDKDILEIGTGVGFLSILASKMGAKSIVSCEGNSKLFEIAQKNLKLNSIENVQITNKTSYELDESIGTFDIIIHELFSNYLFSESILPVLMDAKRFLNKNGRFLPGAVRLIAKKVNFENVLLSEEIESCGVKLSGLNELPLDQLILFPNFDKVQFLDEEELIIFNIDFNSDFPLKDHKRIHFSSKRGEGYLFYFSYSEDLNSDQFYSIKKGMKGHWPPLAFISSTDQKRFLKVSYSLDKLSAELVV